MCWSLRGLVVPLCFLSFTPTVTTQNSGVALARQGVLGVSPRLQTPCKQASKQERERERVCDVRCAMQSWGHDWSKCTSTSRKPTSCLLRHVCKPSSSCVAACCVLAVPYSAALGSELVKQHEFTPWHRLSALLAEDEGLGVKLIRCSGIRGTSVLDWGPHRVEGKRGPWRPGCDLAREMVRLCLLSD